MRVLLSLTFVVLATSAIADIGASADSVKEKYGAMAEIKGVPTSYAFRSDDLMVEFVFTPSVSRINVFFLKTPQDTPEALLERFSGRSGWKRRPLDDPEFGRQFPDHRATDSGNRFYLADEVYALVKPDSGGAKLMLLIQTSDFLRYLNELRKNKKMAQPGIRANAGTRP